MQLCQVPSYFDIFHQFRSILFHSSLVCFRYRKSFLSNSNRFCQIIQCKYNGSSTYLSCCILSHHECFSTCFYRTCIHMLNPVCINVNLTITGSLHLYCKFSSFTRQRVFMLFYQQIVIGCLYHLHRSINLSSFYCNYSCSIFCIRIFCDMYQIFSCFFGC